MKAQAIVFTEHHMETLDSLIKKAAAKGQTIKRGSDFLKFNTDEALNIAPTPPKVVKTIYGTKETESKVSPSTDYLISLMGYGKDA